MEVENSNLQPQPEKYNYKIVIAILFIVVLSFSAFNKFIDISVNNKSLSMDMMEVKGVVPAISMAIIYVYSLFAKKKKAYYISILLIICSYGYTLYAYLNLSKVMNIMPEFIADHTQFGEGLRLYIVSFILFIIDIFVPNSDEIITKSKTEKIEESLNIENHYILANYIYGLANRSDLYNKLSAIVITDAKTLEIILNIESENQEKIIINQSDIVNINCKSGLITKENLKMEDYDVKKYVRDFALFGGQAAMLIGTIRGDRIKDYYKVENTKIYEFCLIYKKDNENKKIMFQTRENPTEFLAMIKKEETSI